MDIKFRTFVKPVFFLVFVGIFLTTSPAWPQWNLRLVKDTKPGISGDHIQRFVTTNELAFYVGGNNYFQDYRLYRTDGSVSGTFEVCPKGYYSTLGFDETFGLATTYDRAIFTRNNSGTLQLWQSDGTIAGTTYLMDFGNPYDSLNVNPNNFISAGHQVFFTKIPGLLYRSDGSISGTYLVKDFYEEFGIADPLTQGQAFTRHFCLYDGFLYFTAGEPMNPQISIWCSDGTDSGTKSIWQPGTEYDITGLWSTPDGLYAATEHSYFDYDIPGFVDARELWRILPINNTAQRVYYQNDVHKHHGVLALTHLNGQIYFSVYDAQQIWKTAGGSQATMVAEIPTPTGLSYAPSISPLEATNTSIIFRAQTAAEGIELWSSDGTAGGTHLLRDFNPGTQSSEMTFIPFSNGELFISAQDTMSSTTSYILKTDGTDIGTIQVLLSPVHIEPTNICQFNDGYLLMSRNSTVGIEPFFLYEGNFSIIKQPTPIGPVEVNSMAKFTVEVPLWAKPCTTYQWFLNNVPINSATDSQLIIPVVQYPNSGSYACRVTYNEGVDDLTVLSNSVYLSVVEEMSATSILMLIFLMILFCVLGVCYSPHYHFQRNEKRGQ